MTASGVHLDHIALHVTNLERSILFYRDILKLEVTNPVDLAEQSGVARLTTGSILGSTVKGLMKSFSPQGLVRMNSRIAFAKAGDGWNLLLVEQKHPEKGYVRSVDGNTIFGLGCTINHNRDIEDLAWDLEIAGASFRFGDPFGDGGMYTVEKDHHLYVSDPDQRVIELIPDSRPANTPLITGLHHITLYSGSIEASRDFYEGITPLRTIPFPVTPSGEYDRMLVLGEKPGHPVIILFEHRDKDMTVVTVGGHGLDHFALSGWNGNDGETATSALDIIMNPEKWSEKTKSLYLSDPDHHQIERLHP